MWHLTACKISVGLSFSNCIKNEMIFYRIFELMLATLKGNETIKDIVLKSKELYKQWILTQIWSKSVEN